MRYDIIIMTGVLASAGCGVGHVSFTPCTPLTCQQSGKNCGSISDGCGGTLQCGQCQAPDVCGAGGVANVCGCPAESPAQLCARYTKNCGSFSAYDACQRYVVVDCGRCSAGQVCGAAAANVCGARQCDATHWCSDDALSSGGVIGDIGGIPGAPATIVAGTALAADDAWAVGSEGALVHWDGSGWSPVYTSRQLYFGGIWAASPTDIWVAATTALWHDANGVWSHTDTPPYHRFRALWGTGPDNVWIVGDDGTLYNWDGSRLNDWTGAYTTFWSGVWGSGADDVWVVGGGPTLLHWTGTSWGEVSPALGTLTAIDGTAANDIWAVGPSGVIAYWNGSNWSAATSPTTEDLNAVWARTANDAWIVGNAGVVLHWNGTVWQTVASGTTNRLLAVWGVDSTTVWVAGQDGTILRYAP